MANFKEVADILSNCLKVSDRGEGDYYIIYDRDYVDNLSQEDYELFESLENLIMDLHEGSLPRDLIFDIVDDYTGLFSDNPQADLDQLIHEQADSKVLCYKELSKWAIDFPDYVNEALTEFQPTDYYHLLSSAFYLFNKRIGYAVLELIESICD